MAAAFLYLSPSHPRCCVQDGWTPLHVAAAYGKVEVADLLVKAGAPLDAKDNVSAAVS